ncbi:hypothetical protein BZG36_05052 [Bifiguratus adelaidae]|uniref:Uncharacterized protein n=1 Tax=Bifiguratus adelaidae TaxID=1938954 RepID=A0A261XYR3_9FUNG|nr:hypothetical protein BZG36_05052 [Bifiguratus adelaidae]
MERTTRFAEVYNPLNNNSDLMLNPRMERQANESREEYRARRRSSGYLDTKAMSAMAPPTHELGFNPSPLGLWAFSMVTFLLSATNLFTPHMSNTYILPSAIMFGGLAQFIAGLLDFFSAGTFGGTVVVSYGAFWTGQGITMLQSVNYTYTYNGEPDQWAIANGLYHVGWCFYTFLLTTLSLKLKHGSLMLTFCLFFVGITILFLALSAFLKSTVCQRIAGVTGLIAAIGAWYKGAAEVLEEEEIHLPLGRFEDFVNNARERIAARRASTSAGAAEQQKESIV